MGCRYCCLPSPLSLLMAFFSPLFTPPLSNYYSSKVSCFFKTAAGDFPFFVLSCRWMDVSAEAVAPLSRRVLNFTGSGRPVWLSKDDEWVSGGWSRRAAPPSLSCHVCSAGMVLPLLCERPAGSWACRTRTSAVLHLRCGIMSVWLPAPSVWLQ